LWYTGLPNTSFCRLELVECRLFLRSVDFFAHNIHVMLQDSNIMLQCNNEKIINNSIWKTRSTLVFWCDFFERNQLQPFY